MERDGRDFKVDVTADGEGLVSQRGQRVVGAGSDKTGLTRALSVGLAGCASAARATTRGAWSGTWR